MATLEGRVYAGDRAREVLDNEVFQQVMSDLKTEITEQWKKSPARDQEGREKLWLLLSLAQKLELMLQTTLETGKLATLDLQYKQTIADRAKSWIGRD